MGFNQKEETAETADIVEVIGQYVRLEKMGKNYMGLCPFHSENEPSFTVNPETQTFHCFGCKKSGDIFSFLEALQDLTEKHHE